MGKFFSCNHDNRRKRIIYIVLPVYNEERDLPALLESIKENMDESCLSYKIIIVNDGSTDNTAAIVREASSFMPIKVIDHVENKGLAEALKTGLLEAANEAHDKDIIITMDSDNSHTPGLIMRMVRLVREGYDVVIASRYQKGARIIGVPLFRRMLSFGAMVVFKIFFPIKGVKDYTCGYRAYRGGTIKKMFSFYGEEDFISQPGFSCMVDVLIKMKRHSIIIGEVPLILRYDLKKGKSKMKVIKNIGETLKLIAKRFFTNN